MTLNVAIIAYFILQTSFLWLALRRPRSWPIKLALVGGAIGLIPILLLVNGAVAKFGDGGALNNILIFVALIGGLITTAAVFLTQRLMARLKNR